MKTFVKFCGLKDPAVVKQVPSGGAAGFVIDVPASPRNISPELALDLVGHVPAEAEAWAVVVDPTSELIHRLFDEVGVDRVQVYGKIPAGLEFLEVHHLVPSVPVLPNAAGAEDPRFPRRRITREFTSMPPVNPCRAAAGSGRIGKSAPAS